MPDEEMWATFFDADRTLTQLGFDDPSADGAEFGCGYGTFTVAAAARTDFSMLLGALFLLIVGAGAWSLDAMLSKRAGRDQNRARPAEEEH